MKTTAKFDIKGKGAISMELKNIEEIENCPAGKIITLNEYTGVFVDFDDTFCINPYEEVCHTLIGHEPMLNDVLEWLGLPKCGGMGKKL